MSVNSLPKTVTRTTNCIAGNDVKSASDDDDVSRTSRDGDVINTHDEDVRGVDDDDAKTLTTTTTTTTTIVIMTTTSTVNTGVAASRLRFGI